MKLKAAMALQIVGAVALVVAAFTIGVTVGFAAAGVVGLLFGAVLEREVRLSELVPADPVVEPAGDA